MRVLKNNDTVSVCCGRCGRSLSISSGSIKARDVGRDDEHTFWVDCSCGAMMELTQHDFPQRWLGAIFANNGIED